MGGVSYYEDVFSIEEVARILKISKRYIMKLIKEGKFGAIKIGNEYRVPKSVIDSFFNQAITMPSPSEEYAYGIWSGRSNLHEDSTELVRKIRAESHKKSLSIIISESEQNMG